MFFIDTLQNNYQPFPSVFLFYVAIQNIFSQVLPFVINIIQMKFQE